MKGMIIECIMLMAVGFGQTVYKSGEIRLSPRLLNYQGYLTDTLGDPITSPATSLTFSIFDAAILGNQKWTETQSGVNIDKGIFSVLLGSVNPIPDSVFASPDRWLQLSIASYIFLPRTRIVSVPFSYTATNADTAQYAKTVASSVGVPQGCGILSPSTMPPLGYTASGKYVNAAGQEIWTTMAPMPTVRYSFGCAAVNGKIYCIGGWNGSALRTNEEYDPSTNTWRARADMPTARFGLVAVAVNGKIYCIGGAILSGYYQTVEEYDPISNTWQARANMPTARTNLGADAVNGRVYCIGGWNFSLLQINEEYDPVGNAWQTKANMPTARMRLGAAAVNGKIYCIGGYDGGSNYTTNEEYDPATNTWATKASMPTARRDFGIAANIKIFVLGGDGSRVTNEEYDPAFNTWATRIAMPTGREGLAASSMYGKIYAIGGYSGSILGVNEEYQSVSTPFYIHIKN